jgi:hypothetical protein
MIADYTYTSASGTVLKRGWTASLGDVISRWPTVTVISDKLLKQYWKADVIITYAIER